MHVIANMQSRNTASPRHLARQRDLAGFNLYGGHSFRFASLEDEQSPTSAEIDFPVRPRQTHKTTTRTQKLLVP